MDNPISQRNQAYICQTRRKAGLCFYGQFAMLRAKVKSQNANKGIELVNDSHSEIGILEHRTLARAFTVLHARY